MTKYYSYPTTSYEIILTQMYVFLVYAKVGGGGGNLPEISTFG